MEAVGIEKKDLDPLRDQGRIQRDLSTLLQLRGKERMEAILSSNHPKELFQALQEEEAYFTIKEIGEQDALPLLSLMSPTQCQYLLDLELWRGYEIQNEKLEHWLPLLLSCDQDAIRQWLQSIDLDTLLLILKKTIRVHLKESDEAIETQKEEVSHFTLDGIHFIEVLNPSLLETIERLLRDLADLDFNLYWRALRQVDVEIKAELEERALHFREARLEDKGFPPMEEALSLYQYLNPKRLKRMLERKEIYLAEATNNPPPSFPMVLKEQGLFFSLCLREMEEGPLLDRLKMELTYMANQVMVADQPEMIDFSTLQGSLRKVGGFLSIGLELLSEGDIRKAREWVERIPLKFLFQVGYGSCLELKWRAEKIWRKGWYSEKGIPLSFLGSPWEERVEGLLRKRPLFYEDQDEEGYREFRSLKEVELLHRDLEIIELIGKLLSTLPPFTYSDGLLWKRVILNTFMDEQMRPSSQGKNEPFKRRIDGLGETQRGEKEMEDSFKNWIFQRVKVNEKEANLLNEIATGILREMDIGP
ncbi:MAG: DUF6178 family protein [Thermodesulfobacteriota bacterium]